MAEKQIPETRSAYRFFRPITTRWMDNDIYGHVNNVVYYSWFDTAVNAWLIEQGVLDIHEGATIGLMVENHCNYFAPVAFPQMIETGLRVGHVGNSSVRYEIGIFAAGKDGVAEPGSQAVAQGHIVHVYVDRETRRPVPLPAALRTALKKPGEIGMTQAALTPSTTVDEAIRTRMSVRAFTQQPVAPELIREILDLASRAPSGSNAQPWKVYVLRGAARDALVEKVCAAHDALRANPELASRYCEEYDYYPRQWVPPYLERRRENGWGLYGLLGIEKGNKDAMHKQHQRNYRFFDAPVGLMFTVDKVMGAGSLIDYGAFLQNLMLAARARGLHTCPQAAWNTFASIILPHIGAGENEMLVCGMALGYADKDEKVNTFYTPRVNMNELTKWME